MCCYSNRVFQLCYDDERDVLILVCLCYKKVIKRFITRRTISLAFTFVVVFINSFVGLTT
jgi:hypothetical protein